jgi:hypothetical protein
VFLLHKLDISQIIRIVSFRACVCVCVCVCVFVCVYVVCVCLTDVFAYMCQMQFMATNHLTDGADMASLALPGSEMASRGGHCLLSAVCCLPSAVCCLLSRACYLLPAVCCLVSALCFLLSAVCSLLVGTREDRCLLCRTYSPTLYTAGIGFGLGFSVALEQDAQTVTPIAFLGVLTNSICVILLLCQFFVNGHPTAAAVAHHSPAYITKSVSNLQHPKNNFVLFFCVPPHPSNVDVSGHEQRHLRMGMLSCMRSLMLLLML